VSVRAVSLPIVFTSPGTYDVGGGKQKTAFSAGTVYFRHGAKSEPGTSEDLRAALERELARIRSSWLDGIAKVVTAPVGATVSVLPGEVTLSGAKDASTVRLVNDDGAPAFKAVRTDLLYPYRPSGDTSKPAIRGRLKTGHRERCPDVLVGVTG
jgi:hypothetical protein